MTAKPDLERPGTRWPPRLGQRSRVELALAFITGGTRAVAAALVRRALLAAGWLLGAAKRLPLHARRFRGPLPFVLRRWHAALAAVLGLKLLRAALRALRTLLFDGHLRHERARLQGLLLAATCYDEWATAAVQLDALQARMGGGGVSPRQARWEARQQAQLSQRAATLRGMRERGDTFALCVALRLDYMRQAGDITNNSSRSWSPPPASDPASLLSPSCSSLLEAAGRCPVVPPAVQNYIDEVKECLAFISSCPDLPLDDRLAFLRELRHAYGRTGLVLSGGGSLGFWHFGVVKGLLEAGLLPRVVSGSSAGSIGGALLCTHNDAELRELVEDFPNTAGLDFFAHNRTSEHLRHLVRSGFIQDHEFFQGRLRRLIGDLTFLDSYERSGRILNISVTAADTQEPSRLLNYLTAPNVLIWSAVACSSAFPFLFAPQDLMAKDGRGNIVKFSETGAAQSQRRWCDGSLEEDLPMRGLGIQFGCNFYITSQSNPYVVPIVAMMGRLPRWLSRSIESEFKHRCHQLMKIWPQSKLLKLLSQPWEGDINLCLPLAALPMSKSTVNFTPADILTAMKEGQRAVWKKLPAIKAACAIEVSIDEQLRRMTRLARQQARLQKAAAARRSRGLRPALPSWLHLTSLGLPPVESASSLMGGSLTPTPSSASLAAMAAEGGLSLQASPGREVEQEKGQQREEAGQPGGHQEKGQQPQQPQQEKGQPAEQQAEEQRPAGQHQAERQQAAAPAEQHQHHTMVPAQHQVHQPALLQQHEAEQQQAMHQHVHPLPALSPLKQPTPGKHSWPGSRLRFASTGTDSGGPSREGSLHGSSAAARLLGLPTPATPEEVVAEAGVQATAGRLVVAGMEAAQEALGDLEPGTPTVRRGSASEAGGQGGLAGPAAASAEGAAAEEEVGPGLAEPGTPAARQLHAAFHAVEAPPHIDVCGQQAVLVQRSDSSLYAVSRGKALGLTAHYLPSGILAAAFGKPNTLQSVAPQLEAICDALRRP
ncbi:Triacylglycerol lipase SDP1 [Micractinium conductrix]|uniref:Patatin n=1 Tax=Micractinium conductrix TaxID=554055 RepID=A0A2P6VFH6_9CHLO|nr:Triacylglycerol lipase SDP1 [Micractinium conductrix]|eukprot:PSC72827.1 Triacylglycerol lipase SDP1 [Micractinium conductrix]